MLSSCVCRLIRRNMRVSAGLLEEIFVPCYIDRKFSDSANVQNDMISALKKMSVAELRDELSQRYVTGIGAMKKSELVKKLCVCLAGEGAIVKFYPNVKSMKKDKLAAELNDRNVMFDAGSTRETLIKLVDEERARMVAANNPMPDITQDTVEAQVISVPVPADESVVVDPSLSMPSQQHFIQSDSPYEWIPPPTSPLSVLAQQLSQQGPDLPIILGKSFSSDELKMILKYFGGVDISEVSCHGRVGNVISMIFATGRSGNHLRRMADGIVDALKSRQLKSIASVKGVEMYNNDDWMICDVGKHVIQLLQAKTRRSLAMEELWNEKQFPSLPHHITSDHPMFEAEMERLEEKYPVPDDYDPDYSDEKAGNVDNFNYGGSGSGKGDHSEERMMKHIHEEMDKEEGKIYSTTMTKMQRAEQNKIDAERKRLEETADGSKSRKDKYVNYNKKKMTKPHNVTGNSPSRR